MWHVVNAQDMQEIASSDTAEIQIAEENSLGLQCLRNLEQI